MAIDQLGNGFPGDTQIVSKVGYADPKRIKVHFL